MFVPARRADHVWDVGDLAGRADSNPLVAAGVAAIVLGVLSGTTWVSGGFWAPDGAYALCIWPGIGMRVGSRRE